MTEKVIEFLRKKDYRFIKELGSGACGKTILLYDEIIDEKFVCKKYLPYFEHHKEQLFKNFVQEIKLLHLVNHRNIVRVFSYYIYPDHLTGYILMEFIEGSDIEEYSSESPENINEIFLQAIEGFSYLESMNILHRDIRPQNVMVTDGGVLKIIDFGFGKRIAEKEDFDKSITLNWWCETPPDFEQDLYDFQTEVYFVGKLFEKIIKEQEIEQFKYLNVVKSMCNPDRNERIRTFFDIRTGILSEKLLEIDFDDDELYAYREFSKYLSSLISKIEQDAKYYDDIDKIQANLDDLHKRVMLEEDLPDNADLTRCFINGAYFFSKKNSFPVRSLKAFIDLLRSCSREKRNIVLSNLHSRLDALNRYEEKSGFDDDIPF
ncbi:MAG: protein kinase family protein [Candidatus Thiodiazotropha lotti]|nr:protein kinase family protein [Candidatus Thiodiazotropha lotti]